MLTNTIQIPRCLDLNLLSILVPLFPPQPTFLETQKPLQTEFIGLEIAAVPIPESPQSLVLMHFLQLMCPDQRLNALACRRRPLLS